MKPKSNKKKKQQRSSKEKGAKRRTEKKTSKNDSKTALASLNVDELLNSAQQAQNGFQTEAACQLYQAAAIKLKTDNFAPPRRLISVLEQMGELKVSLGDLDGAKVDLTEALQVLEAQPDNDKNVYAYHDIKANTYLTIGQLCQEEEALESYRQGISNLEACIQVLKSNPETVISQDADMSDDNENKDQQHTQEQLLAELHQKLAGAHCTVAELYMTDLCYAPTAESDCEQHLTTALQITDADGKPTIDALQAMANLRLSQAEERRPEAIPMILQAYYSKLKEGCDALAALVGLSSQDDAKKEMAQEQAVELNNVDAVNNLPEFEFRCQTSKLLLECASLPACSSQQKTELVEAAISVLGSLLAQNDEVIEIWYLLGCAFVDLPDSASLAKHYLSQAETMIRTMQKTLEQQLACLPQDDDEERPELEVELEDHRNQLEDVMDKLQQLGDVPDDDEGDDMEE